ncbi:adenosylhomocysteine nucleosidase [Natranaerovirga pectinivora]|uniref:adenosylhomocysteine nucleosidase n=1 Tax=Natranaerovirga pectinivora TaxID=682400 RepID=A0A4R3MGG3_9FIRM|nr:5'-methylthioadenosine/adenosylhomocysteine nucleosidase [Natranaerovirga pectinivora]TCT12279.1 adenosylhomocysteine nucleosidase [Natranaerovirga pectinivora]
MKRLGIIGAMEEEIALLKEKIDISKTEEMAGMVFYTGTMRDNEIILVKSGIGKVNAAVCTQILIDKYNVEAIINTGVAGGIAADVNIGDIVISSDTMQHDVDATGFGYKLGEIPRMETSTFKADEKLIDLAKKASEKVNKNLKVFVERIVSGDQFISNVEKKNMILEVFNGYCTEMEGAAIAQVSYLNQVPFVVIRAISDKADDSAEINFNEFVLKAAEHSSNMIELIVDEI